MENLPLDMKATAAFGSINVTDGLTIDARVRFASADAATQAASMANAQVKQATQYFDKAEVTSDGNELHAAVAVSGAEAVAADPDPQHVRGRHARHGRELGRGGGAESSDGGPAWRALPGPRARRGGLGLRQEGSAERSAPRAHRARRGPGVGRGRGRRGHREADRLSGDRSRDRAAAHARRGAVGALAAAPRRVQARPRQADQARDARPGAQPPRPGARDRTGPDDRGRLAARDRAPATA